ncbi:uncharacterized protein F5147DRAFT_780843 [Suillus discolor]|uniref:DUF6535 domain-containing protein n=1 Tax=Suillus discolor TaxID=1912936 RepID=A0A9P7JLX4_9AGAM|nr:uncharacterized protein F5147DRAFT_780843 [Suillus discolor]KAG2088835.1 hypothetical protein F5147DRAFT_780843 [Suillus discolor]
MSEASNTYGVEDRRAHNDEQPPPEQDTVGPTKDLEEKEDCGSSSVKLSSAILNAGPSQSSEPHKQESNFNDSPDGGLASEAENVAVQKDQPNLSELCPPGFGNCFEECQGPSLLFLGGVQKSLGGIRCHVLRAMQRRLDIVLVFHIFYRGDGAQSPSDTTNLLLTQLEQIGLGNLTAAGSAAPASTWSPPTLSTSLLAAFGTVLDKQWLRYHKSNKYGRGSQKERGKLRQEKFDGLVIRADFYFTREGKFDPANIFNGRFADVKLSCHLTATRHNDFGFSSDDFLTIVDNLRAFEKMIRRERDAEFLRTIHTASGVDSIRLVHHLFTPLNSSENSDDQLAVYLEDDDTSTVFLQTSRCRTGQLQNAADPNSQTS